MLIKSKQKGELFDMMNLDALGKYESLETSEMRNI